MHVIDYSLGEAWKWRNGKRKDSLDDGKGRKLQNDQILKY